MIEQGMMEKNGAARSITPGNEVGNASTSGIFSFKGTLLKYIVNFYCQSISRAKRQWPGDIVLIAFEVSGLKYSVQ